MIMLSIKNENKNIKKSSISELLPKSLEWELSCRDVQWRDAEHWVACRPRDFCENWKKINLAFLQFHKNRGFNLNGISLALKIVIKKFSLRWNELGIFHSFSKTGVFNLKGMSLILRLVFEALEWVIKNCRICCFSRRWNVLCIFTVS